MLAATGLQQPAAASDYFHPDLLRVGNGQPNVDHLLDTLNDNDVIPGRYEVTLYLNQRPVAERAIDFLLRNGTTSKKRLYPCLLPEELQQLGIILSDPPMVRLEERDCVDFEAMEFTRYTLNWASKSLELSIPQAYLDEDQLLRAQEKLWSEGIDNFSMNYSLSSFKASGSSQNYYVNLRPGINIGPWRYRNYSTWIKTEYGRRWNTISNTVSRSLIPLHSELTLGDSYTPASIFDSYKFRGVQMQSSQEMTPLNMRSYVPAISGMVSSDAQITVRQGENVVYQNTVPAGPYEITDYYPSNYGGDLTVTVQETGGATRTFVVPFATLPIMEKKGRFKYNAMMGKHIGEGNADEKPNVGQLELIYGLTDFNTVYGGFQASSHYKSAALGLGTNLGMFGALASDITFARHDLKHAGRQSGRLLRFNYAKGFASTGTSISVVNHYHLDEGYRSFRNAYLPSRVEYPEYRPGTERNQLNVVLSQPLPNRLGAINLTSSYTTYRGEKSVRSLSLGYQGSYQGISYSLYFQRFQNARSVSDNYGEINPNSSQVSLNISIPLSRNDNPVWASYSATRSSNNDINQTAHLNGNAYDNRLNWGVYQGYGNRGVGSNGGVHGNYHSPVGDINVAYAHSHTNKNSFSAGMSGAVTVSEYGAVLSQQMYDSNALIVAPGAEGLRVKNGLNTETNGAGLGIVPGLASYRNNTITLEATTIPEHVDLQTSVSTNLFPTKGALLLSRFDTQVGYKIMFIVKNLDIPSGAQARALPDGPNFSASGFNQVYLVAPAPTGEVEVSWSVNKIDHSCRIAFDLSEQTSNSGLYLTEAECVQ